ncbi:hypothetical protein SAMN06272735_4862 [Streptomyces sp. TLI_55]|uniref:hypothetical protein n=1 Tax=Streptomyces sp. TLI_55 TaxID=1938861 RepID=UPI000BCACE05|nr:hypothetical protein [Streptomyces sp. TLI_55]SNX63065.1 hypothetical protein SAMN06272735_4862 [Streptomyces sp. TLI_55]
MRRISLLPIAALTALCGLALAGCGTERAADASARTEVDQVRPGSSAAATPRPDPADDESGDSEFLAFMMLLNTVVEPCAPELPTAMPPEESEATIPADISVPDELPLPDEPPPTSAPRDPEEARQEIELSSVEKCEAREHTRRITKALAAGTADPAPGDVAGVLRKLGYLEERIDGPQRARGGVEFTLDLRVMGGSLCLSGTTTGTKTTIEPYGADVEVACTEVRR